MENSEGEVKVIRLSRREKERKILEMWENGHSYKEICSALRVSPKTVSKVLRKMEEGEEVADIERLIEERVKEVLNERLGAIEERLVKLEKWREAKWEVLADLERYVLIPGRLYERVPKLEKFCAELEKGLKRLSEQNANLKHDINDLHYRIKHIEDRFFFFIY